MSNQVLCFGEVLWDTFDDGKHVGGAPLNVARQLIQQNIPALMITRIGNDPSGQELLSYVEQHQLASPLVQVDDKLPTCEVTVQLDEQQQATYLIPEPVSWDNIQLTDELLQYAEKAAGIVFGSLACRGEQSRTTLLELLSRVNIPLRVFDVNLRPPHYDADVIETLAAMANVVKMNEEEAGLLIHGKHGSLKDQILEFQHKFHTQTICVTRGENGAIIWHNEEFYEHSGFKVQVVDTVGAGDAFLATLTAGLINQQPINLILERACKVGAYVASQRGANPAPMAF